MTFLRWLFSTPRSFDDAVLNGMAWGVIVFVVLVIGVFSSGMTFGQQCEAAGFERGSADWHSCVERLGKGGKADG